MVYTMEPFKRIADRDKSKDKYRAIKEISYCFFMCDFKSPYTSIVNIDDRKVEVKKALGITEPKDDQLIIDAITFYNKLQETPSMKLLDAAQNGIDKLTRYLNDFEFDEMDDKGKRINDPAKITIMLKSIGDVCNGLKTVTETVKKEMAIASTSRGQKNIGMFERPSN